MRFTTLLLLVSACLCLAALAADKPVADTAPIFDIPRLDGITIDGDPADWGNRGLCVGPLLTLEGQIRPPMDYDARFRLGWNDQGVLFVGLVRDSFIVEEEKTSILGARDCIELFMGKKRNELGFYQVQIASGADPKYGKARFFCHDYRYDGKLPELTIIAAGKRTADGYVLEVLLPFSNLGVTPARGLELALQVWMTDSDTNGDWFRTLWYPDGWHGGSNTSNLQRIRLSDHASPAVQTVASGTYERFRRARVNVYAVGEFAGKPVVIKEGRKTLATGVLERENEQRAKKIFSLPMPPPGKPYGEISVLVDGKRMSSVMLPKDIDILKAREFLFLTPAFQPSVFGGTLFPQCDYVNPQQVEDLIGPYTIKTTFYDNAYNQVINALKPGRYGAVVEVIPESGERTYRRFLTLYRVPDGVDLDKVADWVTVSYPKEFGFDAKLLTERNDNIRWQFAGGFQTQTRLGNDAAVFLAGLADDKAGAEKTDWHTYDGLTADRRYWVGLKRKLYGFDKRFPNPFVSPKPMAQTATVIHEGTLEEAGMKPDTRARLDALCKEWAANSDEAFTATVVRHGVIVFNGGYGTRDKEPMTARTNSYIASITKFYSGACMTMLVDQGIIDLDDDIGKAFPLFQNQKVKTPWTIRRMYSHYNGGWDHSFDAGVDGEEMIAWYYPNYDVGTTSFYNGQGYGLGARLVELVSGESLHDFYDTHLFKPLGCTDTYGHLASFGIYTTGLDMAKMAQMVLNKGAYGNQRFFSEVAWKKMMPSKLTPILGPDTDVLYGIGCIPREGPGLSNNCVGHHSGSSSTFIIDLDNDLIITMARNAPGSNFNKYNGQYMQIIGESMVK